MYLVYKAKHEDPIYRITLGTYGGLKHVPLRHMEIDSGTHEQHEILEIIESIVGWHISKTKGWQVLGSEASSISQVVAYTWHDIVHSLKGQWDQI